jgi:hypothetical protein
MKCQLTGMPELKLGLNDKALFEAQGKAAGAKKAVELEVRGGGVVDLARLLATRRPCLHPSSRTHTQDIKFHQCVRLTRFESDRTISFVPPDGETTARWVQGEGGGRSHVAMGLSFAPRHWWRCARSQPQHAPLSCHDGTP